MPEGLAPSLEEAFAAAEAELGMTDPDENPEDLSSEGTEAEPAGEQAPAVGEGDEHPEGDEADNPLDLLGEVVATPPALTPEVPEFWNQEVEVAVGDSTERTSLDEMRKGYLRQADYTKKTQDLARERGLVSEAVELHKALREDPQGFARYLAVKAGLLSDEDVAAIKGVDFYTSDDIEAKVAERLEQAIAEHPDIKAANEQQAISTVEQVFAGIEQKWNATLSAQNRIAVLQEAQRRGTTDIELTFESMLLRANQVAQQRKNAKKTATARPGGAPSEEKTQERKIETVEDAMNAALEELSASVG